MYNKIYKKCIRILHIQKIPTLDCRFSFNGIQGWQAIHLASHQNFCDLFLTKFDPSNCTSTSSTNIYIFVGTWELKRVNLLQKYSLWGISLKKSSRGPNRNQCRVKAKGQLSFPLISTKIPQLQRLFRLFKQTWRGHYLISTSHMSHLLELPCECSTKKW